MQGIDPEGRLTRQERLATVIAVALAVAAHLLVLLGWGQLFRWAAEERKKERLMVIRRVRDTAPTRDLAPTAAPERRAQRGSGMGAGERTAPHRDAPVKEQGPEPPPEQELSPKMEEDLREQPAEEPPVVEHADNTVSVVTDLPAASFSVSGPAEFRGSGTFWIRKGAPPGTYTATFHPVAGYATPPLLRKDLVAGGQIVFVGKYKRSSEVVVEANEEGVQFTIFRPDGRPLDMDRPGRVLFEDLPPGAYTAVFKDLAGHVTPAPQVRNLVPGGKLSFYAEFKDAARLSARQEVQGGERPPDGAGGRYGGGRGAGAGDTRAAKPERGKAPPQDRGLDRRVQMVVKSYPPTDIEDTYEAIPYPELVIRRGNFQQGWCQVYLILWIDERGRIAATEIERPSPAERDRFESLIKAVENSVVTWNYARVEAEVHVDVRFYVE